MRGDDYSCDRSLEESHREETEKGKKRRQTRMRNKPYATWDRPGAFGERDGHTGRIRGGRWLAARDDYCTMKIRFPSFGILSRAQNFVGCGRESRVPSCTIHNHQHSTIIHPICSSSCAAIYYVFVLSVPATQPGRRGQGKLLVRALLSRTLRLP